VTVHGSPPVALRNIGRAGCSAKKSCNHGRLKARSIFEPQRVIEDSAAQSAVAQKLAKTGSAALVALEKFVADS
jgi:hypothetical protein